MPPILPCRSRKRGRSVLLVDAHLDCPGLHAVFGLAAQKGLAEILEKDAEPLDALIELETHLRFLPAGLAERNPADAMHSAHFTELCGLLRQKFEYVVFDGPSMLESSDACVLATAMDQILVVMRPNRNRREEVIRVTSELQQRGGNLIGVAANCWDIRSEELPQARSRLSLTGTTASDIRASRLWG